MWWKAIIQLVIRIWNKRMDNNENPKIIELRKKQAADNAIATGDVDSINKQLDDGLRPRS